jgi:AGCS family alanine or glycine:cation symporter
MNFAEVFEALNGWIGSVNDIVWGPPMLILLVGTHLFLTVRLKFIQRFMGMAIRMSFSRKREGDGDVSQFGALMTALAATIGTGNIVGVATAVALGGPGAVLWCWLTGVFGIATKYSEAVLAVKYREKTADGTMLGGPMYALEKGLKQRWLAVTFCVFTAISAFGIGNMVQANSIADLAQKSFGFPTWATGLVLTTLTAVVILGGVKSIARVCEILVPFMAVFYIIGCLVILGFGWQTLPDTVVLIVTSAFTGKAAAGGFAGATIIQAMRYGVARGLFSNESGLGSAPIVAAAAQTPNPVRQALVSATGTFWDTVVVCALTGLTIVNTGAWMAEGNGASLTKQAFETIPYVGPITLTVGLLTFVFSTIIGWSYYGERAMEYLFGKRTIMPYRIAWVLFVFVGSVSALPLVWNFSDMTNALMAIPNLIALLLLNKVIVAETKTHLWDKVASDSGSTTHRD